MLRRLLQAVDAGRLAADGPAASALVRQMQGALAAVDLMAADVGGGVGSASQPTGPQSLDERE
jgi:hypothetical protein